MEDMGTQRDLREDISNANMTTRRCHGHSLPLEARPIKDVCRAKTGYRQVGHQDEISPICGGSGVTIPVEVDFRLSEPPTKFFTTFAAPYRLWVRTG